MCISLYLWPREKQRLNREVQWPIAQQCMVWWCPNTHTLLRQLQQGIEYPSTPSGSIVLSPLSVLFATVQRTSGVPEQWPFLITEARSSVFLFRPGCVRGEMHGGIHISEQNTGYSCHKEKIISPPERGRKLHYPTAYLKDSPSSPVLIGPQQCDLSDTVGLKFFYSSRAPDWSSHKGEVVSSGFCPASCSLCCTAGKAELKCLFREERANSWWKSKSRRFIVFFWGWALLLDASVKQTDSSWVHAGTPRRRTGDKEINSQKSGVGRAVRTDDPSVSQLLLAPQTGNRSTAVKGSQSSSSSRFCKAHLAGSKQSISCLRVCNIWLQIGTGTD